MQFVVIPDHLILVTVLSRCSTYGHAHSHLLLLFLHDFLRYGVLLLIYYVLR